jgi:hypothetical protein
MLEYVRSKAFNLTSIRTPKIHTGAIGMLLSLILMCQLVLAQANHLAYLRCQDAILIYIITVTESIVVVKSGEILRHKSNHAPLDWTTRISLYTFLGCKRLTMRN